VGDLQLQLLLLLLLLQEQQHQHQHAAALLASAASPHPLSYRTCNRQQQDIVSNMSLRIVTVTYQSVSREQRPANRYVIHDEAAMKPWATPLITQGKAWPNTQTASTLHTTCPVLLPVLPALPTATPYDCHTGPCSRRVMAKLLFISSQCRDMRTHRAITCVVDPSMQRCNPAPACTAKLRAWWV